MTDNNAASFLEALTASLRKGPLQPHIVLVGSNLLGIHLRHALAETSKGHANIRFMTFVDLAERLTRKKYLETGRRLFPSGGEELLLRELCAHLPEGSAFYQVREQEGFHQALRATFHDLIDGGIPILPRMQDKLGEIARLFHIHRKRYLPKFAATADLVLDASLSEESFSSIFGTDTLFCYGFYDLTEAQRRLLAQVAKTAAIHAWLPIDDASPAMAQKTHRFFKSIAKETSRIPSALHTPLHALSTPDASNEAEETVRWLIEKIEKERIPLHRIAILLRNPEEYAPLFAEALHRASLSCYREGGTPLSQTRAGKAFLLALGLLGTTWTRSEMVRLLTLFPFRKEKLQGVGAPPDWDRWTREAFVVGGKENFLSRLSAFSKGTVEAKPFLKFFREWIEPFEEIVMHANDWREFGERATAWFLSNVENDENSAEITRACRSLSDLTDLGIEPTESIAKKVLKDRVRNGSVRGSVFERDGIYVGSLVSARAVSFDIVCIPGMVERSFPAPPRPDPLLLDEERREINRLTKGAVTLREGRLQEERILFDLALAQASKSVLLSYPRLSSDHRERLPSSFLQRTLQKASIRIDERPLLRWNQKTPAHFIDAQDWLSSEVGRRVMEDGENCWEYLTPWSPLADNVQRWVAERLGSRQWGAYDGVIGSLAGAEIQKTRFSAKNVSDYATCPYQYFLRHIVRLKPLEAPDEVKRLRPLDKGNLIHEVLFRLFTKLRDESLLPLKVENREKIEKHLNQIAEKVFEDIETRLPTGPQLLWSTERHFILSDLRALIDLEIREASLFQPMAFEVRFGLKSYDTDKEDAQLSTDRPVSVSVGHEKIELSGKIDRIDLSLDKKRARIVDYKSGALDKLRDDQFGKGKAVQLPVYLSALSMLLPDVDLHTSEAILLSTSYGSGFRRIHFSGATLEARQKEFHQILSTVSKGTRSGVFPPNPGKNMENCKYCDFQPICGRTIQRIFERKVSDPSAAFVFDLEEIA